MKKRNLAMLFLVMSALVIGGCSKPNDSSSASTDSSSQKKSSKTSTSERPKKTATSESSNSDMLSIMIEASQSQIPAIKEQFAGVYSDLAIAKGEGNTIIYTFTFAETIPAAADVEAMKPALTKGMKAPIDAASIAIPDIKIQIIFNNPDQSEIMNFIITKEDTDAIGTDTE